MHVHCTQVCTIVHVQYITCTVLTTVVIVIEFQCFLTLPINLVSYSYFSSPGKYFAHEGQKIELALKIHTSRG